MVLRWFSIFFVLSLLNTQWCFATEVMLHRQILDRNNKPIVGAEVIIRVLQPETGVLQKEIRLTTGTDGMVNETLDLKPAINGFCPAYLLVTAAGLAVTYVPINEFEQQPIRPTSSPSISGTIVDSKGAPVKDAIVAVGAIGSMFFLDTINRPSLKIDTPSLTVNSATDGSFTLPGMTCAMGSAVNARITATLQREGKTYWGVADVKLPVTWQPAPPMQKVRIVMRPALDVQGQLTDRNTGQPLANTTVTLDAGPSYVGNIPPPVVTDAKGKFIFLGATHFNELKLKMQHKNYGNAEVQLFRLGMNVNDVSSLSFVGSLLPCAKVTGRITDVTSGQPVVPTAFRVTASATQWCTVMAGETKISLQLYQSSQGTMKPDGTFAMLAPVGNTVFSSSGVGYTANNQAPYSQFNQVPAAGRADIVLKVARKHGVLLHFISTAPDGTTNLRLKIRRQENDPDPRNPLNISASGIAQDYQFYDPEYRGEDVEIQVERNNQIVLPWTPLPMEYTRWPVEFRIK